MNQVTLMPRLSLGVTIYKRVIPILWIVFVVCLAVWTLVNPYGRSRTELVPLFVVAVLGFFLTRLLSADLADEVLDGGDHLLVKRDGVEVNVPLTEIERVKESVFFRQGPPRTELILKAPGAFGRFIEFIPVNYSVMPFVKSQTTRDLIRRVERAHRPS
jgi:hypothetical protein